tara:strand:- start:212 stop:1117 length:906 start_codon:yes stop_codon:yes gene_type:complete
MIVSKILAIDSPFLNKNNTGLGNVLFQIFTAFGISKKFSLCFNNSFLNILLNKLEKLNLDHEKTIYRNLITDSSLNNNFIILKERSYMYSLYSDNIVKYINLNSKKNYCLEGYFQSHLYFDDYRNIIIKLLEPDYESINYIKKKYSNLFDNNITNISLHIRNNWGKNIKYNLDFFIKAIEYILNNISYTNVIINVFSDDIFEIEKKLNYKKHKIIFYKDNVDYIDLWCMSMCNHNILSHSTLSWWGAYINNNINKIVVYPKDILRLFEATLYSRYIKIERCEEHYKKEWIALDYENVLYIE